MLAHVVEVATNALVTQERKTLTFPSSVWEGNVQLTLHLLDGVYVGEVQNGGDPMGERRSTVIPLWIKRSIKGNGGMGKVSTGRHF